MRPVAGAGHGDHHRLVVAVGGHHCEEVPVGRVAVGVGHHRPVGRRQRDRADQGRIRRQAQVEFDGDTGIDVAPAEAVFVGVRPLARHDRPRDGAAALVAGSGERNRVRAADGIVRVAAVRLDRNPARQINPHLVGAGRGAIIILPDLQVIRAAAGNRVGTDQGVGVGPLVVVAGQDRVGRVQQLEIRVVTAGRGIDAEGHHITSQSAEAPVIDLAPVGVGRRDVVTAGAEGDQIAASGGGLRQAQWGGIQRHRLRVVVAHRDAIPHRHRRILFGREVRGQSVEVRRRRVGRDQGFLQDRRAGSQGGEFHVLGAGFVLGERNLVAGKGDIGLQADPDDPGRTRGGFSFGGSGRLLLHGSRHHLVRQVAHRVVIDRLPDRRRPAQNFFLDRNRRHRGLVRRAHGHRVRGQQQPWLHFLQQEPVTG